MSLYEAMAFHYKFSEYVFNRPLDKNGIQIFYLLLCLFFCVYVCVLFCFLKLENQISNFLLKKQQP